jgi:hypothetical protein
MSTQAASNKAATTIGNICLMSAKLRNYFRLSKISLKSLVLSYISIIFATECITKVLLCMATTIIRKPASFRLRADLLEGLKRNAARENRTLNNYVESVLLGIVYDEPNELTKAAINEATSGKNPNKSYSSVDEMFNDILNNEE